MRDFYDHEHWEQLIETIIDRIGVEGFFETVAYVLEQRCENLTVACELMRRIAAESVDD